MKSLKFALPLVGFVVLIGFLARGLWLDPHRVPSPLIDKPAPAFTLPDLHQPDASDSLARMKGQVFLLNVWGSWCVSCREEHPVLMELARSGKVPIVGLNWRDDRSAALDWLNRFGDPYLMTASDSGQTAIDYGVYGAPETFVIDKNGTIRDKVIGPLTPEILQEEVLPLVARLNQ